MRTDSRRSGGERTKPGMDRDKRSCPRSRKYRTTVPRRRRSALLASSLALPERDHRREEGATMERTKNRVVCVLVGMLALLVFASGVALATTFTGTGGGDDIEGTRNADDISARGGNDYVDANGGDDTVKGGSGRDTINGSNGADTIFSLADVDRIAPGEGDDRAFGYDGADTLITSGGGDDNNSGGDGDDTVNGRPRLLQLRLHRHRPVRRRQGRRHYRGNRPDGPLARHSGRRGVWPGPHGQGQRRPRRRLRRLRERQDRPGPVGPAPNPEAGARLRIPPASRAGRHSRPPILPGAAVRPLKTSRRYVPTTHKLLLIV